MDTLSDMPDTSYELPLSEADQAALRPALLRDLGATPFTPGAPISRSLWVIFVGEWGVSVVKLFGPTDRREFRPRVSGIGV